MGCDIHLRVQVKAPKRVEIKTRHDGSTYHWETEFSYKGWRCMENLIPNDYWQPGKDAEYDRQYRVDEWYHGRNYNFFAILGNVRNGHGFAGIKTGSGFDYISDCRGLPPDPGDLDFSDGFEYDKATGFFMGDHSHSWVTLTELLAVGWDDAKTRQVGVVSPAQYLVWKEKGQPDGWSGDVSGQTIRKVSNQQMEQLIAEGKVDTSSNDMWWSFAKKSPDGFSYYTTVEWTNTYAEAVGPNVMEFIDRLKKLCAEWAENDTDRVRLVFGFDS